ncbi:hypothetical protein Y981_08330 [Leptospirillum ferriphilum YSK]|uniref:Uncharacterized protein n=2 Tax=Nitrospiraceae TaxID=189779 RepID=A0A059XY62_9BACT|nr:hypothetical protein Y981_08330 [Leptospirillum ferriphilum YSK]
MLPACRPISRWSRRWVEGSRGHVPPGQGSGLLKNERSDSLSSSCDGVHGHFFRLVGKWGQGGEEMDKKTAGYRAFATRIVTRGAFTAEQTHLRVRHTVERALLVTVVAIAFFLFAHH